MSSNAYAAALRLELKPSRQRRYWRWITHLAAMASATMLHLPWLIATGIAVVLLSLYRTRTDPSATVVCQSDGNWVLYEDSHEHAATLAETPFVQPWLVILPLRVDGHRRVRRIAIFPDNLPAEDFRRLRVRLLR